MQKVFFTVLVVVAVLVTIRLNNYPEQKDGLFANPASTDTLIPDAESPDIATTDDDTAEKENDEADTGFKEEHPEITSGYEETLIEESF